MTNDQASLSDAAYGRAYTGILRTMNAYLISLDTGDFDTLGACFLPDGILEVGQGVQFVGPIAIGDLLSTRRSERYAKARPGYYQRHHMTSHLLDIHSAEAASATSYYLITTDLGIDSLGVYHDEFRLQDGRWRLALRRATRDWTAPASLSVENFAASEPAG